MGLTGTEDECVAGFDRRRSVLVPCQAGALNHMVKLPLGAMRMIRVSAFPRRNPDDLDIKGMTLHQIGRERFAAQGFGHLLAGSGELAFGRSPRLLLEFVGVDLTHARGRS